MDVFEVIKNEWDMVKDYPIYMGSYGRTFLTFNSVRRIIESPDFIFTPLNKHLAKYLRNTYVEYIELVRDNDDNPLYVYICYVRSTKVRFI